MLLNCLYSLHVNRCLLLTRSQHQTSPSVCPPPDRNPPFPVTAQRRTGFTRLSRCSGTPCCGKGQSETCGFVIPAHQPFGGALTTALLGEISCARLHVPCHIYILISPIIGHKDGKTDIEDYCCHTFFSHAIRHPICSVVVNSYVP